MPLKRVADDATVAALHKKAWDEAKIGNDEALVKVIEDAAGLNCKINPMWNNGSQENSILTVAVCSGSVKSVEKIVELVQVPDDALLFTGIKPSGRSRRIFGGKSSYWLTRPCNPFVHAVKSVGIPKKYTSKGENVAETSSDENVVEVLRALRPILRFLPESHRRLIMNDGVLTRAVQYNLFRTVQYLIAPGSMVDPFYCDPESAGGTYTYVDLAIRYERPVFHSTVPEMSITKLIWERIGGLRGTIYNFGAQNKSENGWLRSIGIDPSTAREWNKVSEQERQDKIIDEEEQDAIILKDTKAGQVDVNINAGMAKIHGNLEEILFHPKNATSKIKIEKDIIKSKKMVITRKSVGMISKTLVKRRPRKKPAELFVPAEVMRSHHVIGEHTVAGNLERTGKLVPIPPDSRLIRRFSGVDRSVLAEQSKTSSQNRSENSSMMD